MQIKAEPELKVVKTILNEILSAINRLETDKQFGRQDQADQRVPQRLPRRSVADQKMKPDEFLAIRRSLLMTQEIFGEKLAGFSSRHISRLERGDRRITDRIADETRALFAREILKSGIKEAV